MYVDEVVLFWGAVLLMVASGGVGWLIGYEWTRRFADRELQVFSSALRMDVATMPKADHAKWLQFCDVLAEELARGEAIAWTDGQGRSAPFTSRYWLGEDT